MFVVADYTTKLNGARRQPMEGNLGISVTW